MPLRIRFGNKVVALRLGARRRAGGWYAPPGGRSRWFPRTRGGCNPAANRVAG